MMKTPTRVTSRCVVTALSVTMIVVSFSLVCPLTGSALPASQLAGDLPPLQSTDDRSLPGIEGGWRWGYVDTEGSSGKYGDIALDNAGFPHISYFAQTQGDLKYAFQDATGWHVEVVDSTGNVGQYTSIDLDSNGFPHISYYDPGNGDLKVATQDPTGWHVIVVDSSAMSASTAVLLWTAPVTRTSPISTPPTPT